METSVNSEMFKSIYEDMTLRIEMGIVDMGDSESFMENLWEAIEEKIGKDKMPKIKPRVDLPSAMFGAITERLCLKYMPDEWW